MLQCERGSKILNNRWHYEEVNGDWVVSNVKGDIVVENAHCQECADHIVKLHNKDLDLRRVADEELNRNIDRLHGPGAAAALDAALADGSIFND